MRTEKILVTAEMLNPCILTKEDGSKYGKIMFGMSTYNNLKQYAERNYKLTELSKGKFKDNKGIIYNTIFNKH